jgi:hypothetical protein
MTPRPLRLVYQIDGQEKFVEFDVTTSETHASSAEVTQRNVEKGANITDHVRPAQDRLSVEAVITNAPLVAPTDGSLNEDTSSLDKTFSIGDRTVHVQGIPVLHFSGEGVDRVRTIYDALVDIATAPRIVSADTGLRAYHDMVVVNLSAPRTVEDCIAFTFELVKLRFVESRTVQLAPVAKKPRNLGHKPKQEVKKDEPLESLWHKAVN